MIDVNIYDGRVWKKERKSDVRIFHCFTTDDVSAVSSTTTMTHTYFWIAMMTPNTQLLDLPNELLLLIFQYLKSSDLVQILSDVRCPRIQALVRSAVSHLDISEESDEWLRAHLPQVFADWTIAALRLQDKHMALVSNYIPSSDIPVMNIISSDWTTDLFKQQLHCFRPFLKELSITFTYPHGKGDVASYLFRDDSQLEHLHVTGRFLYFDQTEINTCIRLTHLSIELEGMYRLFILIANLPNLQELKVKFRTEERLVQPASIFERRTLSNTLERVTFTGSSKYFDHMEHFFATVGVNIQCLTINLDLMYYTVDGKRLEHSLFEKMPRLSSLELIIHSTAVYCDPVAIETFQSLAWQNFDPVVCWNDARAHQHTIFTLPYRSDRFKHLSNDFISSWMSNRPVSLCFERVRSLSLLTTTPLTLATFHFIGKYFPHLKTVELLDPVHSPGIDDSEDRNVHTAHLSDDLLADRTLQMPSITKLSLLSRMHANDCKIFHRFLHLLPGLVYLQMYIGRSLFRELLAHDKEDGWTRKALMRIQLLQMVRFYDEKNILNDEEIHGLFPNAQILFDYDEL